MLKINITVGDDQAEDSHWEKDYFIFHPSTNNTPSVRANATKILSFVLYSLPFPQRESWPERNFSIAFDFPEVHLGSLSFGIKSPCFLRPPCSWRSHFSLVPSLHCHPFSTRSPRRSCIATALPQCRQPGWGPGAHCGWSCFAFHVKYGWWMLLKEGLEEPDVTSREGWTLPSSGQLPFGMKLDAMLVSCSLLCPQWARLANVLDVSVFAEEKQN